MSIDRVGAMTQAARDAAQDADTRSRARQAIGPSGFIGGRALQHAIPPLTATVITCGALFNGFNNALGGALACLVTGALLILLLLMQPPSLALWRKAAFVLLPIVGAVAWASIGMIGPGAAGSGAGEANLAPDLFEPKLLGVLAGAAALLVGWLVALRAQRIGPVIDLTIALNCVYLVLGLVIRGVGNEGALDYWDVAWHGRFAGTIGNANVTAAVAGAVAVLALTRLLMRLGAARRGRLRQRDAMISTLHGLALAISLGAAIATASRFVFLATLAILIPLASWAMMRQRRRLKGQIAILVACAAAAAILSTQYTGLLFDRFDALASEWEARQQMWSHYLTLARASPWFGYGLGSFGSMNEYHLRDPRLAEALWTVNSPHNLFLQLTLKAGLPYLLLILGAAIRIALDVAGYARRAGWPIESVGIIATIGLIIACSMVDIALDVPAVVVLTLFLAGLLWGRALAPDGVGIARPHRPPVQQERRIGG